MTPGSAHNSSPESASGGRQWWVISPFFSLLDPPIVAPLASVPESAPAVTSGQQAPPNQAVPQQVVQLHLLVRLQSVHLL